MTTQIAARRAPATPPTISHLAVWRAIFADDTGYLALLSLKAGTPAHEAFYAYPAEAEAALRWCANEDRKGRDVYAGARLFDDDKARSKDDPHPVTALYADLDGCPLPTDELAPSVTIETSDGHYDGWWVLTTSVSPDRARALNERLAHRIGADPSGADLSQVLRVVGTHNWKPDRARPLVSLLTTDGPEYDVDTLAALLPELPEKPKRTASTAAAGSETGGRPGDDYAARTDWPAILEPHGWRWQSGRGAVAYWCRPGKDSGVSASMNYGDSDLLYVFTSSTDFERNRAYGKFGAYTVLNHAGDFTAAARALAALGYGQAPTPIRPAPVRQDAPAVDAWRADLERDLAAAQEKITQQARYIDDLVSERDSARKLAEERRHDIITIRELCESSDIDPQFKMPAIAFFIAGKHDPAFATAYDRPVDLFYGKVTELTGIKDGRTIKKTLAGLDAGNLITTIKIPCSTKVIGKNGKPLQGFRYQVQFGPREGEAPLTLQERARLLAHPDAAELRPKGWGQKRPDRPRCAKHPEAELRREWYCSECGDQVHEDTVAATPCNDCTTPPPITPRILCASTLDKGRNDCTTPPAGYVATVCNCGQPLRPGEACHVCDLSACGECGEPVQGTLSRFCAVRCRFPRPSDVETYDSPPAELLEAYGAAAGGGA